MFLIPILLIELIYYGVKKLKKYLQKTKQNQNSYQQKTYDSSLNNATNDSYNLNNKELISVPVLDLKETENLPKSDVLQINDSLKLEMNFILQTYSLLFPILKKEGYIEKYKKRFKFDVDFLEKNIVKTIDLSVIDNFSGYEFEYFCAELLRKNGFENAIVTPLSGDHGADILAEKNGDRYAIQCKRYSSTLGSSPIKEICNGMEYYGCQTGVIMTNSSFSHSAEKLASEKKILLWDSIVLQEMLRDANMNEYLIKQILNQKGIKQPSYVRISEIIDCCLDNKKSLTFPIGKNIYEECVFCNLERFKCLLITGLKEENVLNFVNSVICLLLLQTTPEELKLLLVGKPYKENIYKEVPHLIKTTVDDSNLNNELSTIMQLISNRQELLNESGIKSIQKYNAYFRSVYDGTNLLLNQDVYEESQKLPYIVIVFYDVMELFRQENKVYWEKIQSVINSKNDIGVYFVFASKDARLDVNFDFNLDIFRARVDLIEKESIESELVLDPDLRKYLFNNVETQFFEVPSENTIRSSFIRSLYITNKEIETIIHDVCLHNAYYNENQFK